MDIVIIYSAVVAIFFIGWIVTVVKAYNDTYRNN